MSFPYITVDHFNGRGSNLYAYVNNDPLNLADPSGLIKDDPEGAALAAGPFALDFVPVVGDVKGFYEAYQDPTAVNIAAAAIGSVPGIGDAAGKFLKAADAGIRSLDDLSRAAAAVDRGGLTAAGRGLEKHGGRSDSVYPLAKGNVTAKNQQAQDIVDDILTTPGSTSVTRHHARFGTVTEVRTPDGRGARYGSDGRFIGFLETTQ